MQAFNTMTEATEYVRTAIGPEFQQHFDVESIAHEMTEWEDGKLVMTADDDEFWAIVSKHYYII